MKLPEGFKFGSLAEVNDAVSGVYQEALKFAKRECGRGCYRSRGKSIRGVNLSGDVIYGEADSVMWAGGLGELIERIAEAEKDGCVAVYLEGGVDYAVSVREFGDGSYDPWVGEWDVLVWKKPGFEEDEQAEPCPACGADGGTRCGAVGCEY